MLSGIVTEIKKFPSEPGSKQESDITPLVYAMLLPDTNTESIREGIVSVTSGPQN